MGEYMIGGKKYKRNDEKGEWLIEERNIVFEDIIEVIKNGDILDNIPHPNQEKYPHQYKLIVKIRNYAYDIPYVRESDTIYFLKTIIPSRKSTKRYLLNN